MTLDAKTQRKHDAKRGNMTQNTDLADTCLKFHDSGDIADMRLSEYTGMAAAA
jgi:hypothetical protein